MSQLNNHSLRITKQRQIILDELCSVTSHPTADVLYQMVRKRLPKISLGTVYRNLEIMSECGIIQKLDIGGTQKRFDGAPHIHYHVR
ncbi:MAG: transcriptional repressor, partial [Deltaproteobacteria bacterium HGW-Deltaproteobacteria-3]